MSAYADFAYVYDALMEDLPYDAWVEFYEKIWADYGRRPKLLLDAGCGTGSIALRLAEKGMEVIGCDMSEDMLGIARDKAGEMGLRPLFLHQSMEELDLYGTVDGVISSLDCINYLPDFDALCAAMARISLFMEPGALFIFDINTEDKLRGLDGQTIVKETEDVFCVWQNEYLPDARKCRFTIDIFVAEEESWQRYGEEQLETAFTDAEIREALTRAGLALLACEGPAENMPETAAERRFYIAEKK